MSNTIDIMSWFGVLIDLVRQCDQVLFTLTSQHPQWIFGVVFLIIFCETGLIIAPFLPGDSLLFVVGALAAQGHFNGWLMGGACCLAAILGGAVNYQVGYWSGAKLLRTPWLSRWISPALQAAQHFYVQYGGKSLVLARFAPILRTFAPFIAGLSQMPYGQFSCYNLVGALLWVCSFTAAGYFFGNLPIVKNNLHYLLMLLVGISLIMLIIQWWRQRRTKGL